jgi:hypothetical protein
MLSPLWLLSEEMEGVSLNSGTCVGTVADVNRGVRAFQESGLRFKIPGTRTVTWDKGDAARPTTSIRSHLIKLVLRGDLLPMIFTPLS